MERLSSGYKINKAGDNPAGIALSSKMRAQIAGLDQAESNATDGVSVLNIADGALSEVSSVLQRIRELAVQAANDTNTYSDRQAMQDEIDELKKEVDRISTDTEYNAKTLLDGSCNTRSYSKEVERLDVSDEVMVGDYSVTVESAAEKAECSFEIDTTVAQSGKISISGVTMKYTEEMNTDPNAFLEALRNTAEQAGCEVSENSGEYTITSKNYGSGETFSVEFSEEFVNAVTGTNNTTATEKTDDAGVTTYRLTVNGDDPVGKDVKLKWNDAVDPTDPNSPLAKVDGGFSKTASYSSDGKRVKITDINGFSIDFMVKDTTNKADEGIDIEVTDIGAMTLQVGANQYQEIDVKIPEISSETLYLDTVDVTVVGGANKALTTIDEAISKLGDVRSAIGAYTNRLEYATDGLSETQLDLTSALSTLTDTDMAQEITDYTQWNVLEQAAMSVLTQANDIPEQILSLLR
jgi:flagellin